ncbi:MAG: hypothetical protein CSA50_02115 [Gammaproteobacteria bacterium]|nr:MAG: hypothetical protein CSA50_02115 [Gammaproteobacteria bacterium]
MKLNTIFYAVKRPWSIIGWLSFALSVFPAWSAPGQPTNSNASLVAHYSFEQLSLSSGQAVFNDDSGNGNTAVSVGSVGTIPVGRVCKGVRISDNSNSRIIDAVNSGVDINDKLGNSGTIMLWYKAANPWVDGGDRTIVDASTDVIGNGKDKYFYLEKLNDGRLRFSFENSNDEDFNLYTAPHSFNAGEWVHVAVTWDLSKQTMAVFVNGLQAALQSINSTSGLGDFGNIYFGDNASTYGSSDLSANGDLDEIRLYDKALTEAEIANVMSASHACSPLVAHYTFEQPSWTSGSVAIDDYTGNGNAGVSVGAAVTDLNGKVCKGVNIPFNSDKSTTDAIDSGLDINDKIGNQGTIMLWYKARSAWMGSRERTIVDASGDTVGGMADKYFFLAKQQNGSLKFSLEDSKDHDFDLTTSANFVLANWWVHLAIVWDLPGQTMKIFKDGSLAASRTLNSTQILGDLGNIYFGDNSSAYVSPGASAYGVLDEIRLYNTALTEAEIADVMNASHDCFKPLPVAHYAFEQPSWVSGPVAIGDHTGNGNAGVSVGAAVAEPDGQVCKGVNIPDNSDKATIDAIDSGLDINDKLGHQGTIMLWYKASDPWVGSGERTIVDAGGDTVGGMADKYFFLATLDDGTLRFSLEDSQDHDFDLYTGSYSVGADAWVHLAIVWDLPGQTMKIFKDGSLAASRTLNSTQILGDLGNIYFGDNSSKYVSPGASANGVLDEIRLYDIVLTEAEIADAMAETHDCSSCTLGAFIVTQPEYGLACPASRAAVNVTARCDDGVTIKTDYLGTVSLSGPATSTFYEQATGGSALTQYTFTAPDSGSKTFYLYYNDENPNVHTTVSDALASVSSTASSGTDFRAQGFLLSMDSADTHLPCNKSGNITLTAFGQTNNASGQACEVISGFTGNKNVDVWFNVDTDADGNYDDANRNMIVNGTSISANTANSDSTVLSFMNGKATFHFAYQDVGKVKALNFRHDSAPYNGSPFSAMNANSGPLVFYPASFALTGVSGSPTHVAGAPFELGIQAQCTSGADPIDYQPNTAGTLQAALVRTSPTGTGVNEGQLTVKNGNTVGSSSSVSYSPMGLLPGDFDNSGYSYQADYSEVGQVQLHIRDTNYFGVTTIPAASINMGRFIPDHFRVAGNTPTFANGDGAWTCNMTYQGQDFEYAVDPQITLTAYSAKNQVTKNYGGSLWRYGNNTFANRAYTNQAAVDSTLSVVNGSLLFSGQSDFNGEFTVTIDDVFTHNKVNAMPVAADAPFATNIDLLLTASDLRDADSVCVKANAAAACQSYTFTGITGNEIRYGRAKIENAFGPETRPLKIPMTIQHWTGTEYTTNTQDNCSSYSSATPAPFSLSGYQGGLSAGETTPQVSGVAGAGDTFGAGKYVTGRAIELSAPGLGNTGSVITTHSVPSWLQFDWDGNGTRDNPSGEAIFGQYRGHDRIIYWQEVTDD